MSDAEFRARVGDRIMGCPDCDWIALDRVREHCRNEHDCDAHGPGTPGRRAGTVVEVYPDGSVKVRATRARWAVRRIWNGAGSGVQ